MGIIVSFVFSLLLTPAVVKAAGSFNSPIKDELQGKHGFKKGTCSLGSVAIIISYAAGAFISGDRQSLDYLFLAFPFFLIGFADDMLKFRRYSADGFKSITKLILQLAASVFAAFILRQNYSAIPDFVYYPLAVLFITATVNALNITDGLDGLAAKVTMPMLILSAAAFPSLRTSSMILFAVLAAYLVYNSCRASIFMGDGGSHFIGAFIALTAFFSRHPAAVVLSSAVIYLELLSSFIQIIAIRVFSRKVFLIAPFHHHLEMKGVGEEKIVDTFFSISVFTSLLSAILFVRVL